MNRSKTTEISQSKGWSQNSTVLSGKGFDLACSFPDVFSIQVFVCFVLLFKEWFGGVSVGGGTKKRNKVSQPKNILLFSL